MDTNKYKALYLQETGEHLSGIEEGLLALEKDAVDPSVVNALFRHFHSIKGMSASMQYDVITKLSHAQESLLDQLRTTKIFVTPDVMDALFKSFDCLKSLVRMVEDGLSPAGDIAPYVALINAVVCGAGGSGSTGDVCNTGSVSNTGGIKKDVKAASAGSTAGVPPSALRITDARIADPAEELRIAHLMKVDSKVFDDLLASVGELFMSMSSFKAMSLASRSTEFKDGVHALGKSVDKLHNQILSARMLPIADVTEGLPRIIRDMSKRSAKEIAFAIEGGDITLDRAILEGLGAPLVHIIRNGVDHGIESLNERKAAGKRPAGSIVLRARAQKDRVIIEVIDDGKGIDPACIRKKAVENGVDAARVNAMSDKEALMLVCLPGLSNASVVTDTSGRGVGMDVVKNTVEGLGGALDIVSVKDKGTKIVMTLPRTTAITRALLVGVGHEQFMVPISRIEKVLELNAGETASGVIRYLERDVPVVPLAGLLRVDPAADKTTTVVLLVERHKKRKPPDTGTRDFIGFEFDSFGLEINAYIKPLMPPISRLWGVSGITIMGDGRPVFLIDVAQILARLAVDGV